MTTTNKLTTNVPATTTTALTTTTATLAQTFSKLMSLSSTTADVQSLQVINIGLYTEALMRRLTNYNKILDEKMTEFNLGILNVQPRILFVFPDANSFEEYIERKIKDKQKQELLKKFKMLTKIIAALVMSISFLFIVKTVTRILTTLTKSYNLKKDKKEKVKRKNKQNKRKSEDIIDLL